MEPQNLRHLLSQTQKCTINCPVLDRFLKGGIPCNSVTELVAESGCGKTQLCLQLLLSAQLPASHGGLSASSLYIHSEFPFPLRRLCQLSLCLLSSHAHLFAHDPLDRIYVHAVHTADQLLDVLRKLDTLLLALSQSFPVKVVVIDSIAALFRSDFENNPLDLKRRCSLFFKISSKLKAQAKRFNLAILLTNQVVDFMGSMEGVNGLRIGNFGFLCSSDRRVCASLGLSWANCVNSRLFLSRHEEVVREDKSMVDEGGLKCVGTRTRRQIQVVFAPHLPESSCKFEIKREGVFGIDG